jgi:hypothetical protein
MSRNRIPLALIVLCIGASEPSEELGGVTGTIHDLDGKPLQGFTVKTQKFNPGWRSWRREKKNPELIATAITDADGRFAVQGIQPDGYTLVGGNNTIGWLYQEIDVKAGKTLDVGVIRLVRLD